MAGLGLILEQFDGSNFGDYVDRLDSYFWANEVAQVAHDADEATKAAADKKKSAALVTLLEKSGFSTLKDLCLPDKPLSKSYTELCKLLQTHYDPKASVAAESYRFHQATQGAETAKDFANILKRLVVNCQFGDYLQRALRDQFVRGLRSRATTRNFLQKTSHLPRRWPSPLPTNSPRRMLTRCHTLHWRQVPSTRSQRRDPTDPRRRTRPHLADVFVGAVGDSGMPSTSSVLHGERVASFARS